MLPFRRHWRLFCPASAETRREHFQRHSSCARSSAIRWTPLPAPNLLATIAHVRYTTHGRSLNSRLIGRRLRSLLLARDAPFQRVRINLRIVLRLRLGFRPLIEITSIFSRKSGCSRPSPLRDQSKLPSDRLEQNLRDHLDL